MAKNESVVLTGIRRIRAGFRCANETLLPGLFFQNVLLIALNLALAEVLISTEQPIVICYDDKDRKQSARQNSQSHG